MTPRFPHVSLLFLLVGALCLSPALGAQTAQTGSVEGRVVSADGSPVPDAVVLLRQADGAFPKTAVTAADGRFRFGFLPPARYELTVQADGYVDQRLEELRVSTGGPVEVRVTLEPMAGEFGEELQVTAARPLIDSSTTAYDSTLSAREIDLLPTSRTATDLIQFTPGARPDQVWGGSTEQANAYQLDGVSVNQPGFGGDFLLPNVDWIEEFQVEGLGSGAEYGNFQGGLVNIVTKSGSNTVAGSARFNFEDESLNDSNVNVQEVGEEQDQRWEANASVGGPLVEDSLYYFASVQRTQADFSVVDTDAGVGDVVFLPVREERELTKILGKINWQASESGSLSLLAGFDDVQGENRGLSSFTDPEATTTQDSPAWLYNATWNQVLGGSQLLEVKLAGYDGDDEREPKNGDLPAVQLLTGNRDLFTNAIFRRNQEPSNVGLTVGWDGLFETGDVEHNLKIGGTTVEGSWLEERLRTGNLTWRFEPRFDENDDPLPFSPDDPSTWGFISSDWGGTIRLDAETTNSALWVQDYLDLSERITLSAGLRFSRWEGELTPGITPGPSFTALEEEGLDPRLGLVVDFAGDGRWIGKAHFGRYHQSLFALLFDRTIGGDVFQDTEFWDWIGPGLPDLTRNYTLAEREELFTFFDSSEAGDEVGPIVDYDQPFVDQIVVGLEHALTERWRVGGNYVHRKNDNVAALVDRNLASNYTLFENVSVFDFRSGEPILDADGNPLVLERIFLSNGDILARGGAPGLTDAEVAALSFDEDLVITNPTDAEREFDQIQIFADRAGAGWSLSTSLVWTDLEGNFFSVSGYDDPFGTGAGPFVRPNEQINFSGDLANYSEWEAKVRWTGNLPWNLRAGVFLEYRSGDFFTPFYEIDNRNHDFVTADGDLLNFRLLNGVSGEDVFLEDRGNRELPEQVLLDLHLSRGFALSEGLELFLGLDVFNVLEEDAVVDVRELVNDQNPSDPTTLFGAPQLRVEPRTVRLEVGLRF